MPAPDLKATATRAIKISRNALLLHQPFFGTVSFGLNYVVVEENDPLIITAATDNEVVYFNPAFMLALNSVADREFVQAHEIMHVITMSLQRMGSRNIKFWNAATDYCINAALVKAGMKMPIIPDQYGKLNVVGLYDKKYTDMIPEEIYELLIKNGDPTGSLDQHVSGKIIIDSDGASKVVQRTQNSIEKVNRRIKGLVAQAAINCKDIPGVLKRMIELNSSPQIDWKEILNSKMLSYRSSDYQWTPPEKSLFWTGITIPNIVEEATIKASLVIDVSGSINASMLNKMFTEVIEIASTFSSWELQIVLFDHTVETVKIYTSESDTYEDILNHDIIGGGGTLFRPFFEYIKESDFEPDVLIIFTDGYSSDGWIEEFSDVFDVLWIMNSDKIPTWGQYVKFDNYS
jgi:predicted metal-dependent peptidase